MKPIKNMWSAKVFDQSPWWAGPLGLHLYPPSLPPYAPHPQPANPPWDKKRKHINLNMNLNSWRAHLLPPSLQYQWIEERVSFLYGANKQVPLVKSLLRWVNTPGSSILLQSEWSKNITKVWVKTCRWNPSSRANGARARTFSCTMET